MTLWIALGLMTVVAALIVVLPMIRKKENNSVIDFTRFFQLL